MDFESQQKKITQLSEVRNQSRIRVRPARAVS